MAVRLLGAGTTVEIGARVPVDAGVPVDVGVTVGATVAAGLGSLAIVAVGAAVGKSFTCTVGRIVSLGDCV